MKGSLVLIKAVKHLLSKEKFDKTLDQDNYCELIVEQGYDVKGKADFWNITEKDSAIKVRCRKYSSDLLVFHQIFVEDEFKELIQIINHNGIVIKNIIDVGSNIGLSVLRLAKAFPKAKFVCVEPDPSNFEQLSFNMINNHIDANLEKKGVWKDSGLLYFDRSFRDGSEWSVALTEEKVSEDYIEAVSINTLVDKYKIQSIDLLKIDIEGGERYIFNLENKNLAFLDITKAIAIEIHDEYNIKDIIVSILKQRGFQILKSGEYLIGLKRSRQID